MELFYLSAPGTPVNRIPIMAKQVLDLYMLYKLVTEKGGLVEVINKKIWREITKGLNLPTSITSAAFTLRTQYMKYLYPYECEKKGLSSPGELQAAIDSNRREGRRPGYSASLYRFSSSPSTAPHILSSPKMHLSSLGGGTSTGLNGLQASPGPALKKAAALEVCSLRGFNLNRKLVQEAQHFLLPTGLVTQFTHPEMICCLCLYLLVAEEVSPSVLPSRLPMAMALGQPQLARAAALDQLREKLEASEGPERKVARLAEEQHRLMQQAFQRNLLAMASQVPMGLNLGSSRVWCHIEQKLTLSRRLPLEDKQDLALSITCSSASSITVSVELNGTVYSGMLFAQRSAAAVNMSATATPSVPSGGLGVLSSTHSPSLSSSSSKGPSSAEPSTSGSP
ncbi:hypothetical protein Z043_116131 [Scleropages formosus]|uniref:AT-rich interactive domain-containing protein 3 n=1 Tax=Scleropages formosus TaxID=113540 RepID=A0A0P7U6J8_SCLFO|nr:hypothetical protein Z043_116131 [Scleropages formosus]